MRAGLIALCLAASMAHAETAMVIKNAELRSQPFSDADAIANVANKSPVTVLGRRGAWINVQDGDGHKGWLRLFDVRTSSGQQGDSGIAQLGSLFKTGSSGDTVSNGVKGLDDEDSLKNPQPSPEQVSRLKQFASNANDATAAARQAKLTPQTINWLPARNP